jgi:hypothetical protein
VLFRSQINPTLRHLAHHINGVTIDYLINTSHANDEYKNLKDANAYTKFQSPDKPQYSDCTITILTSANTPVVRFKYYDAFPTTLSSFVMSSSDSPDNIITADATFRYSYFDIEKIT